MIFSDLVEKSMRLVIPEFGKLLELALKNQKHPGDLLLLVEHGFHLPDHENWNEDLKKSTLPYMIGPNTEGYVAQNINDSTFNHFSSNPPHQLSHSAYRKSIEYTQESANQRDRSLELEKISVVSEMPIYLSIWETEMFIKRMTLLADILNGETYNWRLTIKRNLSERTGRKISDLRNELPKKLEGHSPALSELISNTYNKRIRNAIAHANYYIIDDTIGFNDSITGLNASITFAQWAELFHSTVSLQQGYLRFLKSVHETYVNFALANGNRVQIQINDGDFVRTSFLIYDPVFDQWNLN